MRRKDTRTVGYWRHLIKGFCQTLGHATEDYHSGRSENRQPVYNLDFSLLAPVLFDDTSSFSKEPGPEIRETLKWLMSAHTGKERYVLAVSGAMYYEFLDRLLHVENIAAASIDGLDPTIKNDIISNDLLLTRKDLKSKLLLLTKSGRERSIANPCQKLAGFFDDKKLYGIGDFISAPANLSLSSLRTKFDEIYRKQRSHRSGNDKRMAADAEFHYKMDAANICLSMWYSKNDHAKTLFVTDNNYHVDNFCRLKDQVYGRHFFTPLHLKNLEVLEDQKFFHDYESYLTAALSHSTEFIKEISGFDDDMLIGDLPPFLESLFISLWDNFCKRLITPFENETFLEESKEVDDEIKTLVSDTNRLKQTYSEIRDLINEEAPRITDRAEAFGAQYIQDFKMDDDPIFRRISKRFNLKY